MFLQPNAGPASNSFENPRKAGFMTKHGGQGIKANWKKRYFVLDSGYLFYYASENVRVCIAVYRQSCASVGMGRGIAGWREVADFCSMHQCLVCG